MASTSSSVGFGTGWAYRCQVCTGAATWRLERYGDAVVTWADDQHLLAVLLSAQAGRTQKARVVVTRHDS